MRIIFMGTPEFASASLEAILEAGIEVAAVVTAPDKPVGRGQKMQQPDVKRYAIAHNLPVLQPEKLKSPAFITQLQRYQADLFVVVAFRMLPEEVWRMPPLGTVNLHASLLPQYRGAAPVNWAVINGETMSGTTVFFIEKEIDVGNILSYREEAIAPDDNAGTLHDKLMTSGAQHLVDAIRLIEQGNHQPTPQKTASLLKPAPKIFRETCQINWNHDLIQVHNFIRGLSPYPAAWTTLVFPTGERLTLKIFETEPIPDTAATAGTIKSDGRKCFQIAAANGWLSIKSLQLEGKKRMNTTDFLNGIHCQLTIDS
ncbi:methionyl-tRNA formyltransferase [Bacteroidia bacterium]|nr:methionyl-tRNA formyltransferase [Bacteroidia bacterium]